MTTLHGRRDVRLHQDWPAYRKAYGAYARKCYDLIGSVALLPGTSLWGILHDLQKGPV